MIEPRFWRFWEDPTSCLGPQLYGASWNVERVSSSSNGFLQSIIFNAMSGSGFSQKSFEHFCTNQEVSRPDLRLLFLLWVMRKWMGVIR